MIKRFVVAVAAAYLMVSCATQTVPPDIAATTDVLKTLDDLASIDPGVLHQGVQRAIYGWNSTSRELAVTLDDESGRLSVWQRSGEKYSLLIGHYFSKQQLDGVCLSSYDNLPTLITFDDKGYLAQWLIDLQATQLQLVRTLAGSLNSKMCYSPPNTFDLFVMEEGVGLWRFASDPELEDERKLVAAVEPIGNLSADAESVEVTDKGLWVEGTLVVSVDGFRANSRNVAQVTPKFETAPAELTGDVMDDPVVWSGVRNEKYHRILATDKRVGLRVYDFTGEQQQFIPVGRVNNVDLRPVDNHPDFVAIAAASNRTLKSISLFGIDKKGRVTWLDNAEVATGLGDPYGLCMHKHQQQVFVFVNDKDGRYQQWLLSINPDSITSSLLREFVTDDQPEGCVVDDANQRLFVGVEDDGIYVTSTVPADNTALTLVHAIDGDRLVADVEGLDIYLQGGSGYLVASSQGNSTYAIFDRLPPYGYRGSVKISPNIRHGIDGAGGTDGLAVDSVRDVLVVQDGLNVLNGTRSGYLPQNLKVVEWQDVVEALKLD
ncbi:phytase [Aurantivibrio plasticivorans]